jgi:peptidoglycan-N-acetylglucosamine deacetylase
MTAEHARAEIGAVDSRALLITVDVEDHDPRGEHRRFRSALVPLLEAMHERRLTATFFVVGSLAPEWADDIRQLVDAGHDMGLHGHTHRFLKDLGPDAFRDELRRGRDTLAQITGTAPAGYRAPYFSLTRDTPWAPDIIADEGFSFSSSVLPVWNPQAGFPGAPKRPFRWDGRLVEFPSPVFALGPLGLPVLGGAYLRLVPSALVRLAERTGRAEGRWTYAHPYDFDVDEPFTRLPNQRWIITKLLFVRRDKMLDRVLQLAGPDTRTLADLAADERFVSGLPSYSMKSSRLGG